MDNSDTSPIKPADMWTALGLLTRLPLPARDWDDSRPAACAAWAYPMAGAVVGLLCCLIGASALRVGLPPAFVAALVLASASVLTGAMHEDGLADTADGLWGGTTTARRLQIMKDSHIGAYGVIALIAGFAMRWSALSALIATGAFWAPVLVAATVSRAAMVGVMHALPHARDTGLAHMTGRPARPTVGMAAALGAFACVAGFGLAGLWLIAVACVTPALCAALARSKIGGQTGDILGATQQLTEISLLGAICALTL